MPVVQTTVKALTSTAKGAIVASCYGVATAAQTVGRLTDRQWLEQAGNVIEVGCEALERTWFPGDEQPEGAELR